VRSLEDISLLSTSLSRCSAIEAAVSTIENVSMTTAKLVLILVLSWCAAWGSPALASGSYPGRPPQPPSKVDAAKYNLGKQIYTGKAALGAPSANLAAQQSPRLTELQGKLPTSAQNDVKLPELAGKLNATQMEALEHYLYVRFKVK
jgi:hypothetical protein